MSFEYYPEMIQRLPEADIPFRGVRGRVFQGEDSQVVFFEIDAIGRVDPHSHGAQWGIMLEGKMDLTIGGETKTYRKGDTYFIPAGVVHSATFRTDVKLIDLFEDRDRYGLKGR